MDKGVLVLIIQRYSLWLSTIKQIFFLKKSIARIVEAICSESTSFQGFIGLHYTGGDRDRVGSRFSTYTTPMNSIIYDIIFIVYLPPVTGQIWVNNRVTAADTSW